MIERLRRKLSAARVTLRSFSAGITRNPAFGDIDAWCASHAARDARTAPRRTLDLGCGPTPRNPFKAEQVSGIDIRDNPKLDIRHADLTVERIPFDDATFDYVTAFDFIEHVPRVTYLPARRFPFIELMNEIWRVLKPGGLLYAVTPVYPHVAAFQDPTHVNALTTGTHEYFVRPRRLAAMYGFVGDFVARRIEPTRHHDSAAAYHPPPANAWQRLRLAHRIRRGACGHVIWELEAVKAGA